MILAIDSATPWLSVALGDEENCAFSLITHCKGNHSNILMRILHELQKERLLNKENIDLMVIGTGPGSFTGAKIGTIIGKTLAYVLKCPLAGISTLVAMASVVPRSRKEKKALLPVIFHKKDEVFWTLLSEDFKLCMYEGVKVEVGSLGQCMEHNSREKTLVITPWRKIAEQFRESGYQCYPPIMSYPDARTLIKLVREIYKNGEESALLKNIYTLEPTYGSKVFLD